MRSPVSPALELDGAGSMVNCTIKTEEKKESGYESTPGAAPSTEPRPSDPPGPPPREGTAPPPLPQVGPTTVTDTDPDPGKRGRLFPQVVVPHPKETKLKCVVLPRLFWPLLMLSGQHNLRALPLAWSPPTTSTHTPSPPPAFPIALGFSLLLTSSLSPSAPCAASQWGQGPASWAI